jgi:DNA-binding transcriptional regulator YdaS (Cro superfamily)
MTHAQLIDKLKAMAEKLGSQSALARSLGISPAYLSDVLNGRREPGKSVLASLGLVACVEYRKLKE